jgi:hypothetical protein
VITKRKYKKTQGVGINYCASTKKSRRSQCIVSSSFIMGKCHQIFKSLIYVSKKHISENKFKTKTELAIQIFSKFENFIFSKKGDIKKFIVLIDGVYTNSQIIKYIESSGMKGYIGRYSKGRNIFYNNKKMLLKEYISSLSINDFSKINLNENEKYIHTIECKITGSEKVKMVLVIDDVLDPLLKDIRPLITNVFDLIQEEVVNYYSKRWTEETYHQILKDGFGSRTHKLRSLKAFMRYMELIAVAYTFCEQRRIKLKMSGIFEVKNDLISIANKNYILNMKGNKFKKRKQQKVLLRFVA